MFASDNKGKIKSIFSTEEIRSLKEANVNADVIEDVASLCDNTIKFIN